ncbi:hypothetical protein PoMZ_00288 [Pyricularia oryzae]|uniref:Uncharacterized protein n=1 Tax=Pyricularia oryzae TaxID=318829 RepID=A0A4P7N319_PYROR|nr:hypothetical protein PoMZ_00288 [Pyricularia oryzae]
MPLVPIYVTAENVILETVNEFLEVAERAQSQHADRKLDRFATITNEVVHASSEACNAFAQSRFPAQKQLLGWD